MRSRARAEVFGAWFGVQRVKVERGAESFQRGKVCPAEDRFSQRCSQVAGADPAARGNDHVAPFQSDILLGWSCLSFNVRQKFMIAYLNYGVLGLCAIMLILVARTLRIEQARDKPRREITRLASIYMSFCLLLAILNAYVQISQPKISEEEYRKAMSSLEILRVRVADAVTAKGAWVGTLNENDPARKALEDLDKLLGSAAKEESKAKSK